jgi:hypothetical protein
LSDRRAPLMARLADRQILERAILHSIVAHREFCDTLWLDCSWYTAPYAKPFHDLCFWTLDFDPLRARCRRRAAR